MPPLSKQSAVETYPLEATGKPPPLLEMDDVRRLQENVIAYGRRESGKTTVANSMVARILSRES